ncbi:unnamed protein product [Calypogeia fissa]
MGDLKDEEIGLLIEEAGSSSEIVDSPPPENASRKRPSVCSGAMTLLIFVGLLAVIFTIYHAKENSHEMPVMARRDILKAPFNALVVGDWGREGLYNQSLVAQQMGKVGKHLDVNFIISTGDNFYESGLSTFDDQKFDESFSEIYKAPSLQKTWYAVLGNHDYRGNPEIQVDEVLNSRDSRWVCDYTFTVPVNLGQACDGRTDTLSSDVEFFFIDTNPFEEDYWTPDNEKYEWTRRIPREVVIANQLKKLTEALEASTATWKLVVGHHTMFSYGSHGNTPELIEKILPILEANKVDMYINGHDHSLQHIKREDSDIHFVTSGGGSKAWKGVLPPSNLQDSKIYYDGQGFISISIVPKVLQVNFYDINGVILHQIELTK